MRLYGCHIISSTQKTVAAKNYGALELFFFGECQTINAQSVIIDRPMERLRQVTIEPIIFAEC